MRLITKVFELCDGRYPNLSALAKAMGLSVSQVYRVREGKRGINQKFIIGAVKAFPGCELDELFLVAPESPQGKVARTTVSSRHNYLVQKYNRLNLPPGMEEEEVKAEAGVLEKITSHR